MKANKTDITIMVMCFLAILIGLLTPLCIKRWHDETYMNMDKVTEYVDLTNGVGIILNDGSSVYLEVPRKESKWHYENYMKIEDAVSYTSGEGGIEITMVDGSKVYLEIQEER